MKRSRWFIIGPYLFVVLVGAFGFRQLENERQQDCLNQQAGRKVLREVVIEATATSRPIDLTLVPGFADLDPATQTYLQNLSKALSAGTPSDQQTLRERLLVLVPEIRC